MSIQEAHEWAKKKVSEWDKLTSQGKRIEPDQNVHQQPKLDFENASFRGDVTKRDSELIFHFFPTPDDRYNVYRDGKWLFADIFSDYLGDAFLAVFKFKERLFLDYVPELNSFVVKAVGFGDNPLFETMVENVLVKLKELNES